MSPIRGKRILVVGGTGFIGAWVVRHLLRAGAYPTVLSRSPERSRLSDVVDRIRFISGDVADPGPVHDVFRGRPPHVVIHAGGSTDGRAGAGNAAERDHIQSRRLRETEGLFDLVARLCPSGAHIVRVGSMDEYGNAPSPFDERQTAAPTSAYGAAAAAATALAHRLARSGGQSLSTVRLALVYGPTQSHDFFLPSLIAACDANEPFAMTDGHQRRDFVYVTDVADALCRAAAATHVTGILNVGSGQGVALRDVAHLVAQSLRPGWSPTFGAIPRRPSDVGDRILRIARAAEHLAWRPTTSLAVGLENTIAQARRRT